MSMNAYHCCIIFSPNINRALKKFTEIDEEKGNPDNVKRIIRPNRVNYIYEDEEWIWISPSESCRGYRAHKAYVDVNCTIKDLQRFIEPICCLYCKPEDFKYFDVEDEY